MIRLMPLFLIVPLAMAGCKKPNSTSAAAPASPFAGWSTPDALRARLAGKVELSQIGSDGGGHAHASCPASTRRGAYTTFATGRRLWRSGKVMMCERSLVVWATRTPP